MSQSSAGMALLRVIFRVYSSTASRPTDFSPVSAPSSPVPAQVLNSLRRPKGKAGLVMSWAVQTQSAAVTGSPSCHLAFSSRWKRMDRPPSADSQLLAPRGLTPVPASSMKARRS